MTIYVGIAGVLFVVGWLIMVVSVCQEAASTIDLIFIIPFTVLAAMLAVVWPVTLLVVIIYGIVRARA